MKRRKTYIVMAVLLAVLVLGIGYAAVSDIGLNLTGTANIVADYDFDVHYDTTHTVVTENFTNPASITGAYSDGENATMDVTFNEDNRTAWAIYKVDNDSDELSATLSVHVEQIDTGDFTDGEGTTLESGATVSDYFNTITAVFYTDSSCTSGNELGNNKVEAGDSVYLKVTVSTNDSHLTVNDIENAGFSVELTATPAENN